MRWFRPTSVKTTEASYKTDESSAEQRRPSSACLTRARFKEKVGVKAAGGHPERRAWWQMGAGVNAVVWKCVGTSHTKYHTTAAASGKCNRTFCIFELCELFLGVCSVSTTLKPPLGQSNLFCTEQFVWYLTKSYSLFFKACLHAFNLPKLYENSLEILNQTRIHL